MRKLQMYYDQGGSVGSLGVDHRRGCFRLMCVNTVLGMVIVALILALVQCDGVAFGAIGHGFVSALSEAPAGTSLGRPDTVAVDGASGDILVGDPGSGMVDVFSSSGVLVTQFGGGLLSPVGVAVDEASGLVFVADSFEDAVLVFGPDRAGGYRLASKWSGKAVAGGEFGDVTGVAVDNSGGATAGDVFVLDGADPVLKAGVVDVIAPRPSGPEEDGEGSLVRVITAGKLVEPNGVAVSSSTGRVFVADSVKGAVYEYGSEGALEEKLTGKGSPHGAFVKEALVGDVAAVGVDATSGDVYIVEAERGAVSQYGPGGEWLGWITTTPSGDLAEPRGVGLGSNGEVWISECGRSLVDRFGGEIVVPGVVTGKVAKSGLSRTSMVLPGTIDGEGEPARYRFQYGQTRTLGSQTNVQTSGGGEEKVSAGVEGLQAGTGYFYRLIAEDENGISTGAIREVQTLPAVEGVGTGPVQNVAPESVTLTGSLTPGGYDTHYRFQYGTSRAYGDEAPVAPGSDAGSGLEAVGATTAVEGLRANTSYHYRILAENRFGVTYGEDATFTTPGPARIESEPAGGVGHEQATIHARIDPDGLATTYRVQYGQTGAYGSEAPGSAIGGGSEPVAISTTLTGLGLGVTYHYRILAENAAGTTSSPDETFTTLAPAEIDATYATGVGSSTAVLHGLINPLGHDTSYYFQYGTRACQSEPLGGCTDIPAPPGEDIHEGETDIQTTQALTGLEPNTTYHYRVLATNSLGIAEGPERSFTTSAQALPDSRAWEMVTPPDKGGAPVEALTREGGWILAAEDGNALAYVVNGALGQEAQGNRSPEVQQVLAKRTSDGWTSQDIATPNSKAQGVAPGHPPEYQFFSSHLSTALVEPAGVEPPLAPGVSQATMYLRNNGADTYLPLLTETDTAYGTQFGGQVHFISATPDLEHVVLTSGVALLGEGSTPGLYEWSGGRLQQVSVLPDGRPARGLVELGYSNTQAEAISNTGSRVVWTIVPEEAEAKLGHLYLRDTARHETVQLDAAQGTPEPKGAGTARFQGSSSDGTRIFFTDRQRLTADSTAEPAANERELHGESDLYECEVSTTPAGRLSCHLKDLTVDPNEGQHADVQGALLGTSEDGTSVYFVARGVLASNENGNGEAAAAGGDNLYELHYNGTQWSTTFIATLSPEDSPEWEANNIANAAYVTARVSTNGRYLAFMSAEPLTGYDNVDSSPAAKGVRDEEVYLYDSATASLRCVSCDPTGARPTGVLDTVESGEGLGLLVDRREIWLEHRLAGNIPGWTAQSLVGALYQSRYLSDEGRLYFNSPDDLVLAASNGKEDVYEYEPSGVGSCQSATGGCVSLISGGSSGHESSFLEATPDGSNVFFLTEARLLPQDTDTAFDIYDARECTVLSPCLSPPAAEETACAETATCRPAEPAKQIPAPSGTAEFSGASNPVYQAPSTPAKQAVQARKAVKRLTRGQKLARALRRCRKSHRHSDRKRTACEHQARKHYGKRRDVSGRTVKRYPPKASARHSGRLTRLDRRTTGEGQ